MPLAERLTVALQYLLPKGALTRLLGALARHPGGALTHVAIRRFIGRYGVDMSEAADPNPAHYETFNAFFTRPLRAGVRPLAASDFVCPVDGAISQFGPIEGDQIFQAKGHHYSTAALLGGDRDAARVYQGGTFACIYLSPRDYHRIHMPCAGQLRRMVHVPGELFSVNPATARGVPGLFARNERVVCLFDGDVDGGAGPATFPFALVLVGATVVGSMATTWHGVVNPPRPGQVRAWDYDTDRVRLARGEEMGRFLLGSTVVLLFPPGLMGFDRRWEPGGAVRMGESMGQRLTA